MHSILGLIIVLGFLIFAHESGHFMMAKLFRVRVLVFSLGFGKRLFGFRRGDTDYRVSLVPLGGYVRMAGDSPEENQPANPDEFLSKPKWQRFLILVAGPFMNIVIAILFLAAINMVGTEDLVTKPIIGEVSPNMPAARAGLQPGDRIVSVNEEQINDFNDLRLIISMNAGTPLRVVFVRNGETRNTILTPVREQSEFGPTGKAGIGYMIDPIVGRVEPGSAAAAAGVRSGDRIVAVNGTAIKGLEDLAEISSKTLTKPIAIDVLRGTQTLRFTLAPPAKEGDTTRGIIPQTILKKYTLLPALRESVLQNWKMLKVAMSALARMFRSEGSIKELSGPLSIAKISGEMLRRGWMELVGLMALVSLQLGVMNLLPIPVLDGGHIMILLIEGAARRDLSIRVKERIQQLGFAVLATLMIVVLYNDVIANVFMRRG